MPGRVILLGDVTPRYEAEWHLTERDPGLHVESAARRWEFVERACQGDFDVAAVLAGPIAEHEQRVEAIAGLRRNGFRGRIVAAGGFLTERHDAMAAGADHVFDPGKQLVEKVIVAALWRPRVAADHPWARALLVGQWASVEAYRETLPSGGADVLLATTSCHPQPGFWRSLAGWLAEHGEPRAIVVDDGGDEEAGAEALATGVQPRVELDVEGIAGLEATCGRVLRELWLSRVAAA